MAKRNVFNLMNVWTTFKMFKEDDKLFMNMFVQTTGNKSEYKKAPVDGSDFECLSFDGSKQTRTYAYDAAVPSFTVTSTPTKSGGSDKRVWTLEDGKLVVKVTNDKDSTMTQTFVRCDKEIKPKE